jgi:hypothetical protein
MAQITIIQDDNVVGVDGVFHAVDLHELDANIHAIQFDTGTGVGHIEYDMTLDPRLPNEPLGEAKFEANFQRFVALWNLENAPVVRSLDEIKADAKAQINSRRNTIEQEGFTYLGKVIDSNSASITRITVAVQAAQVAMAAGVPFSVDWTCQDNSVLTMTAQEILGIPAALAIFDNDLHQKARSKKILIDAATTQAEVEAITW